MVLGWVYFNPTPPEAVNLLSVRFFRFVRWPQDGILVFHVMPVALWTSCTGRPVPISRCRSATPRLEATWC